MTAEISAIQQALREPNEIPSDELSRSEIIDICKEISARELGQLKQPSTFATPNDAAIRRKPDQPRLNKIYEQNPFAEDNRRIKFSNAHKRMGGKTQVCAFCLNDSVTTRREHVDRVASVSRAIARCLGANEDLAEAIGHGHDLGHAPLGHVGEEAITQAVFECRRDLFGELGAFKHAVQGLHVVRRTASRGGMLHAGLNLTDQVCHGILSHDGERHIGKADVCRLSPEELEADINRYVNEIIQVSKSERFLDPKQTDKDIQNRTEKPGDINNPEHVELHMKKVAEAVKQVMIAPATLEAAIVFLSDTLTYTASDLEDFISLNIIRRGQLPIDIVGVLGNNGADIINTLITDLLVHSYGKNGVKYSQKVADALNKLKLGFMHPFYLGSNDWTRGINPPPPALKIPPGSVRARMNYLFKQCLEALADPIKYRDSPIINSYLDSLNTQEYAKAIGLEGDALKLRVVMDFIAGCTDRYFIELSQGVVSCQK